jgi:signal transduction histidine kinase
MSIRLKLVLLNAIVVFVGLMVGIEFLVLRTQKLFVDSIDRDLIRMSTKMTRDRAPFNGQRPGPGQRPNDRNPDQNPDRNPDQNPNQAPNQGFDQGPDQGQENGSNSLEDRLPPELRNPPPPNNDIGRPAIYDANGKARLATEKRHLDPYTIKDKSLKIPKIVQIVFQNVPTRVVTAPILREGKLIGFVQLGHDLADYQRLKETHNQTVLVLIPFIVAMATLAGWFLANRALSPVEKVTDAASRINDSELGLRLEVKSNDEIGRLASTFNSMLERLQSSFQSQKLSLERQKQFVGDASHELRTPITRIQLATGAVLEQESTEEELREALILAEKESHKMGQMVEQFLTLARLEGTQSPPFETIDLKAVVEDIVNQLQDPNHPIQLHAPDNFTLQGSELEINRAVTNLIENAKRYSPNGTPIEVKLSKRKEANHTSVIEVSVTDKGPGIAPEHLPKLTERFYRVDQSRNRKDGGTGLGLAIVKATMLRHGGEVHIQSKVNNGTTVTLTFPHSQIP